MVRFLSLLSFLVAIVVSVVPASAQESVFVNKNPDHRGVAIRIAEEFAAPRYGTLFTRVQTQEEAWGAFCSAPSDGGFEQLRVQFAGAAEAWANVEIVRYGPVSEDFRYERILYWPERKNDVARGLTRVLAGDDALTPDAMYAKSVAVQGLSALERLLYDEGARDALFAGDPAAKRRCDAGRAISGNLVRIVRDVRDGWTKLTADFKTADASLAREAATRFATDLLTLFQVVGDQKLDVPMGKSADEAKPKSALYWRSGLSGKIIALNLGAAADMAWKILGSGEEGTNTVGSMETAQSLAESLPAPLSEMVLNDVQRRRLILLRGAVRGARDLASAYVPAALGITVGFNSLDGD